MRDKLVDLLPFNKGVLTFFISLHLSLTINSIRNKPDIYTSSQSIEPLLSIRPPLLESVAIQSTCGVRAS